MRRFSERIGASEVPRIIQIDSMSVALRNSIWNFWLELFSDDESSWEVTAKFLGQFYFKLPVDEIFEYPGSNRDWIKDRFKSMKWYEVYDFVEFISLNYEKMGYYNTWNREKIQRVFDKIFKEELSGYRFISGELVPISSPDEVAAIDSAVELSARLGVNGAHEHLVTALKLLGKRPEPDYRHSIKESISSVESMAKQLSGKDSGGLSAALDELGKKIPLHGSLRSAFLKLYGYTSDESGIRHAILDEPNVGYDEAKYMAVVCSAFVNYLGSKV